MFPGLFLVMILVLMAMMVQTRMQKVVSYARHNKRPVKPSILGLLTWGMPLFVTGDYGKMLGTVPVNTLNDTPTYTLPSPRPGFVYNNLVMINAGGITAGAGAAAGNGAHDVINLVNMQSDKNGKLIDNVRWYALWILGYSIDGFTPIAGVMPAATGAYRSSISIPVVITDSETVTIGLTCVAAHATYHTTSTAFAGNVTFMVDEVPAGSTGTNRNPLAYAERHVDVLGIGGQIQFAPKVEDGYDLYKFGLYTQDTARGTLANDLNTVDFILNGRRVIPPNTLFVTLQDIFARTYKRAVVAGVAFVDFKPEPNKASDQLTILNGAAATVALSGVILCYVKS